MIFEEYEGVTGALRLQMDLMNPLNSYQLVQEPTVDNFVKTAYMPSMAYLGYWGASALVGEAAPSFYVRQAIRFENTKTGLRLISHSIPTGIVIGVPVAASVTGAVVYEKTVNEPLRKSHYGFSSWFGPFASGFGSVV